MSFADLISWILSRLNPTPFIVGWTESRPWRLLIAGIPVLAAIAVAVWLRASMNEASDDVLLRHYLASASECLKNHDVAGAELRYRRAAALAPEDARARFGMAGLAEEQGDTKKARAIMESIANGQSALSEQANRWLIKKTSLDDLDAAGRQILIRRLERATEAQPDDLDLRLSLATIYQKGGFTDLAATQLRTVAQVRPGYRIPLVQLLFAAGRQEAALEEAAAAERHFQEVLAKNPSHVESRFACSAAQVLQKKFKAAIETFEQGAALIDSTVHRKAISAVLIAWAADLRDKKQDRQQVLELTSRSLAADPSNVQSLMMLMDLARDSETGVSAVESLQQLLAAGESPWLIHMILGTHYLEAGETAKGAEHLEQSVKLNPAGAIALNNLAWTLATNEPPELDRAEELASKALNLVPANPQIRETRGQILIRQKRWKEALIDLEAVLPIYSREPALRRQVPKLHQSLATAYEELGDAEMAKRHRELALSQPPQSPAGTPKL